MSYEFIDRPRSEKPQQRKEAAKRAERQPFNQDQYDALKKTLDGGALKMLRNQIIYPAQGVTGGRSANPTIVSQGVRRRLQDKEGYLMQTEPLDETHIAVWIEPEILFCSATKKRIDVAEWASRTGIRLRKGRKSPFSDVGGLVVEITA